MRTPWTTTLDDRTFTLDVSTGHAVLAPVDDAAAVWAGTVLPALHLQTRAGAVTRYAEATAVEVDYDAVGWTLAFGGEATGTVMVRSSLTVYLRRRNRPTTSFSFSAATASAASCEVATAVAPF